MSARGLGQLFAIAALLAVAVSASGAEKQSCVVAIDVGHSEASPGSVSSRGIPEMTFNRNLADRLRERIAAEGIAEAVIIDSKGKSLQERTESARLQHANLFISIHHDSVQPSYLSNWMYDGKQQHYSDRFHGFSLFYSTKNPQAGQSLKLAQEVGAELIHAGFTPTLHHAEKIPGESRELVDKKRGIYIFDDLIVLKTAAMPAVLLECGIIVNRKEEQHLADPKYQEKMVKAVAVGIEKICAEPHSDAEVGLPAKSDNRYLP